ncbi:MAG: glycerophosphodiester phosphodiesterase, partial [Clostridia bacterium]|nr:glycerophosphodiester phosphodiesterase [Clostridia bacterium]
DGELIVIHDEKVDRTTNGTGYVKDMTLAQLKTLDASKGMEAYAGAKIPTLAEAYDLLRDTNLLINVEIKTDEIQYPDIEKKCLALEQEKGMEGRILYSSFNHYILMKIREADPEACIGLLYSNAIVDPWVYAKYLNADAIHPHYMAALGCPGLLEGCRKAGVAVHPWTANDPQVMRALLNAGVEAIITNYPNLALQAAGR